MKLEEIYKRRIIEDVNPAVSVTKFDEDTERVEIAEYVFTDEILNGLFRILNGIKNNESFNHIGIWIDGYYGSGKSHFLKYLDYCITKNNQEKALDHFLGTVRDIDPFDASHKLDFDFEQLLDVASWLRRSTINTCIFNLETSYDQSSDRKISFLQVFWNEFNRLRGFNKFNLHLAQNLEKPLKERGVFNEFKQMVSEKLHSDWDDPLVAADIVDNALKEVVDIACQVAPGLDGESIYKRINNRDTNISIERFALELAAFIKDKGPNYRLIFLADEVSQFINKQRDRYLNLQEIITKLSEVCHNRVWVACTAQQDLSELMEDINYAEETDSEGKIMGRFEIKVSLKGTKPEYITQKRILDKNPIAIPELKNLYKNDSSSFPLYFQLPVGYDGYSNEKNFIDYYPFVPYQFKLIMQVFNNFLRLGYVAKEVKGNERSIIKVTQATAKDHKDEEVGQFISFDELYNSMFDQGLQNRGQQASKNAFDVARKYKRNAPLAIRVAKVLFLICNISDTDKLQFPATTDNITTLLVNDLTTPRLNIREEVEKVIDYLCQQNIIRQEKGKKGSPDTFVFYSEEEMNVAKIIDSMTPDNVTQAEQLREIFFRYFAIKSKETFHTRAFSVGVIIRQRTFLSNNADVNMEFYMDNDCENVEQLAMTTSKNLMRFYLGPQYYANARLRQEFQWYCKVTRYMATRLSSRENNAIRNEFSKRAKATMDDIIYKEFAKILDTCPIISGTSVITSRGLDGKSGPERYHTAMQLHLAEIYPQADLVDKNDIPKTTDELKRAILRPVNSGDYNGLNTALSPEEHVVEIYLTKQFDEVTLPDILSKFSKPPYGWNDICTRWVVNKLVRHHKREYSYANNPHVEPQTVAAKIVIEAAKFTVRKADAIPQETVDNFIDAWKNIFGSMHAFSTNDSTQIFQIIHDPKNNNSLPKLIENLRKILNTNEKYSIMQPVKDTLNLFEDWEAIRDQVKLFNAVINKQNDARKLFDTCKEIAQFLEDQKGNFDRVVKFVSDNKDNFSILSGEDLKAADSLKGFENQEWPVNIRDYIKLMNAISVKLDEKRKEIRGEIRKAYEDKFAYLEKSANEQRVERSVFADRDATIAEKTAPDNITVLQYNLLDADNFCNTQMDRIIAVVNERKCKKREEDNKGKGHEYQPGNERGDEVRDEERKLKSITLNTRTTKPLATEEEIDKYLSDIKQQLMREIEGGFEVTVIK